MKLLPHTRSYGCDCVQIEVILLWQMLWKQLRKQLEKQMRLLTILTTSTNVEISVGNAGSRQFLCHQPRQMRDKIFVLSFLIFIVIVMYDIKGNTYNLIIVHILKC